MTAARIEAHAAERPAEATVRGEAGSGPYPAGLLGICATATMLFAAFTAALLVRRTGSDWGSMPLPPAIGLATAALAASSVAVEGARRAILRGASGAASARLAAAGALALCFLAGQIWGWADLLGRGLPLHAGPNAAFFYLLTGAHGLHVAAGLGALAWTGPRATKRPGDPRRATSFAHATIFWHLLGGLWLQVLLLLVVF